MGSYAAIADMSETLVELLRDGITERSEVVNLSRSEIALVSPDEVGADSDVRLSLYLFAVSEQGTLKNQPAKVLDDGTEEAAPLALQTHYLLTAYPSQSGRDDTANTIDQQRVLGLAMQVLEDNAVLGPDEQLGSLGDAEVRIALEQGSLRESMDEIRNIWYTFQDTTLHPSVTYTAGPIFIESTREFDPSRSTQWSAQYGFDDED